MLIFERLPRPSKIDFCGQHGPNMSQLAPQDGPKLGQKWCQNRSGGLMGPHGGAHGGPWTPMGPLQSRYWLDFGSVFGRFLINFVMIFGRCLVATGCILCICSITQHTLLLHVGGGGHQAARPECGQLLLSRLLFGLLLFGSANLFVCCCYQHCL